MTKHDLTIGKSDLLKYSKTERKKYLQEIRILRSLYFRGACTKTEICDEFGISNPTTAKLLNELIEGGWILRSGKCELPAGRRPYLYALQNASFYTLGIQIERDKMRMAVFDSNNNKMGEFEDLEFRLEQKANIAHYLYSHAQKLIEKSGLDRKKVVGVGISLAKPVSSEERRMFSHFFEKEEIKSFEQILESKFETPVYILNNTKSARFAEYKFGLARQKKNVLFISGDWRIDLGVMLDGRLYSGSSEFTRGFGHIPFLENGIKCTCSKRGCLETVASGMALSRMAREGLNNGERSSLQQVSCKQMEELQPQTIIDAAKKGDQFAIRMLSNIGINLGKGISILIQLLNPELIIIEGKFAEAKKFIITPLQQSLNNYCMPFLEEKTEIRISNLGKDAILLGSVATVMDNFFEHENSRMIVPGIS